MLNMQIIYSKHLTSASKRVRIKCKDTKVLVNVKDVKQLKELKQCEE